MWPFKKKEFEELHIYLKNSFSRVKDDTQNIFQWIQHLNQKIQQQELFLQYYQNQLQTTPYHDHQYYQYLHQRIEQLSQKVNCLLEKHDHHSQKLDYHSQKIDYFYQKLQDLEAQKTKPKASFKEKVIQTLSRHSKNYLKNLIFQYLEQHQNISALQLKDIVVDQQGLASKSTFYRLLAEIEESPQVTVVRDGKQKYFFLKPVYNQ